MSTNVAGDSDASGRAVCGEVGGDRDHGASLHIKELLGHHILPPGTTPDTPLDYTFLSSSPNRLVQAQ